MRFFLELSYKGTAYSGFQVQENANTIQSEVEKALEILLKERIVLTGSSRTDAGVHALQNYFHFDLAKKVSDYAPVKDMVQLIYKMNAILPRDISIKSIREVKPDAHCRFDAISREYGYYISSLKNPFVADRSYHFPFRLDLEIMQEAAEIIKEYKDFTSFSKKNTQAKTFQCSIQHSEWKQRRGLLIYNVKADRFLRGMVRALTATMLMAGRKKITLEDFRAIIEAKDCSRASFAVPAHGLFLLRVAYREGYFK